MTDHDLEPWVPANARPFLVGDRVRVRLSGECRVLKLIDNVKPLRGHLMQENGRSGTVIVWPTGFGAVKSGHSLCVAYDRTFVWERFEIAGTVYAAIELEHLDELPS